MWLQGRKRRNPNTDHPPPPLRRSHPHTAEVQRLRRSTEATEPVQLLYDGLGMEVVEGGLCSTYISQKRRISLWNLQVVFPPQSKKLN